MDYCLRFIDVADKLIIIDSLYSGDNPGTIKVFPLYEKNYKGGLELSLHSSNLIDVIKSRYKDLNGIIIGIEVYKIDYGMRVSKSLKDKFSRIIIEINKIIDAEHYR